MSAPAVKTRFTLETAVALAMERHAGKLDLQGKPYVKHPLRVMEMFGSEDRRIVAVLHDAIEGTSLTLEELVALGCPRRLVEAIDAISRRPGESLEQYLARLVGDPLGLEVKWADIADKHDPARANWIRKHLPEKAAEFKAKDTFILTYLCLHGDEHPRTRHMVVPLLKLLDALNPRQAAAVRNTLGRPVPALGSVVM